MSCRRKMYEKKDSLWWRRRRSFFLCVFSSFLWDALTPSHFWGRMNIFKRDDCYGKTYEVLKQLRTERSESKTFGGHFLSDRTNWIKTNARNASEESEKKNWFSSSVHRSKATCENEYKTMRVNCKLQHPTASARIEKKIDKKKLRFFWTKFSFFLSFINLSLPRPFNLLMFHSISRWRFSRFASWSRNKK